MTWGDWENPTDEHKLTYWHEWPSDFQTAQGTVNDLRDKGGEVEYEGKYIGTRFFNSDHIKVNKKIKGEAIMNVNFGKDSSILTIKKVTEDSVNTDINMEIRKIENLTYLKATGDGSKVLAHGIFYGTDGNYIGGGVEIIHDKITEVEVLYQVKKH
jgi:hypothetical protein